MFKCLLFTFFCLQWLGSSSQNLIANSGFEDRNKCTEFHILCAPEAWFFIPQYIKSSPVEDTNNVEILALGRSSNLRNHLYTKLLCPLEKGETYEFSIKIKSEEDLDFLDVWMGPDEPGLQTESSWIESARFSITKQHVDSGSKAWKKYTYKYTAVGDERYLLLGSLRPYLPFSKSKGVKQAYKEELYSVDDVMLHNISNPKKTCLGYAAILEQVYSQNFRHPSRFIEDVPINKSLINPSQRTVTWVIVDTPPSAKPIVDTLIIPDVLFKFNSSEINKLLVKRLDSLLYKITNKSYKDIEVIGHTDNEGSNDYNQQLSVNRAIEIKNYILAKKIQLTNEIKVNGAGENQPRATNKTPAGRQQNRRVEIILKQ
jgi:outer membrane protein OmpA-like peptidoglycan-associated protein